VEDDGSGGFGPGLPGNWKPVSDNDGEGGGARVFIQTGSKMNDLPDDEDTPF
jgi:replicative DNA helicase